MAALPIKRILCPTDFSELSAIALGHAADLARHTGAGITALYADRFLPPREFTAGEVDAVARSLESERKKAASYLKRYLREHLPAGIAAEAEVAVNDPAAAIAAAVDRLGAELVIMGTHGRTGIDRLVVGSVTERVLRETRVPVLAVRKPPAGAAPGPAIRRILLPTNFTPADEVALQQAAGLASILSADLVVAHIADRPEAAADARERLCAWAPTGTQEHCSLRPVVRQGDPAEQILALAAEEHVDLVVVGAQRRRLFDLSVFGTTTERIIRHAPAPVWVVPLR